MWFNGFETIYRTLLVGTLTYILLVIVLRLTGKRTLSKLNAFDFIVTVALGSTVASILLSKTVALAEGLTALLLLTGLQLIITFLSVKIPYARILFTASPTIIFRNGNFLEEQMKKVRISKEEILQAMRMQGIGSSDEVGAVILETNGELSVIRKIYSGEISTLPK